MRDNVQLSAYAESELNTYRLNDLLLQDIVSEVDSICSYNCYVADIKRDYSVILEIDLYLRSRVFQLIETLSNKFSFEFVIMNTTHIILHSNIGPAGIYIGICFEPTK